MTRQFNLLASQDVIMAPERLTDTESWHRHMPFAFVLLDLLRPEVLVELGSHRGDSYCAFCQGVAHQQLPTTCYAVDTWQGDEHAGNYGSDILDDLSAWHNPRFSRFSTLMRMTFDQALEHFPDGSIDLLHIDGLHTYDAVAHDFNSWLPKLSERAVVLFHDTNVRHGDFAVWQLWHELREQYPAFEFPFGFGLGVLAVGKAVPAEVLQFIDYADANTQQVVDFYYRLGDAAELRKREARIIGLQQRVEGVEQQLAQALQTVQQKNSLVESLHQQLASLQQGEVRCEELSAALQSSQVRLQQVVNSKPWRVRNWIMHVLGQGKRVIDR